MKDKRCKEECFANYEGLCRALAEPIRKNCPFKRTDITWEQQVADVAQHNSLRSVHGELK